MTRKERVFRHIEDNGNAMRYTDIIKFAYEDKYKGRKFDKKENRGFYSDAFAFHSLFSAAFLASKVGKPKGHFVKPTKNGQLVKLSNGLWSVHRPLGWTRNDINCETYETRIEKFLSDGKVVVERDIVSHLKPYVVEHRGEIGYDWGSTNNLLRKMIKSGKVYRVWCLNEKTGKFAYHYGLLDTAIESATSRELDNKNDQVPQEEYDSMCKVLRDYNVTADQLDEAATKYWYKGDGDIHSCYAWAYCDLLEKAGGISDATKALQKEIDELADRIVTEEKCTNKSEQKYMVVCDEDSCYEGLFSMPELEQFFNDKDPDDYTIIEAGKAIKLEKKVTTTFIIK